MRHLITALAALTVLVTACSTPKVNNGNVTAASGQPTPAAATTEQKPPPTWGQRYTWPNGLAIEVAAPKDCKPDKYSVAKGVRRAVLVSITVVNGTKEPFDVVRLELEAQFAGRKADRVTDTEGPCKNEGILASGTVLPGKTFSYEWALAVTPEPGELQVTFQQGVVGDKAVFVGKA